MDPAKAVITESTGAAAGLGGAYLGTKMGGAIGTMIAPGAGTAVGIVVGAVLGGGATWFTSKLLQKNWV